MAESFVYDLIRDAHGEDAARALTGAFGGSVVSVPGAATADNRIARVCGLGVLETLVRARGGEKVYIPLGPESDQARRRAAVIDAIRAGEPTGVICRRHRVSRTHVNRLRAAATAVGR